MAHNPALKLAIFSKRLRQVDVAEQAAIPEATLSKIINGRRPASDEEKKRIATALRMPVEQLFPEVAA